MPVSLVKLSNSMSSLMSTLLVAPATGGGRLVEAATVFVFDWEASVCASRPVIIEKHKPTISVIALILPKQLLKLLICQSKPFRRLVWTPFRPLQKGDQIRQFLGAQLLIQAGGHHRNTS